MPPPIRFVFVLHDHQPVGNFDGVFEAAYRDSYLPMLEALGAAIRPFESACIRVDRWQSGLMQITRLISIASRLAAVGQIEIIERVLRAGACNASLSRSHRADSPLYPLA